MIVTLYQPGGPPQQVPASEFVAVVDNGKVIQNQTWAAQLLGCAPSLVDVLASGSGYLVYSVFDCDGDINPAAMAAFASLTNVELDAASDNDVLRGPVLVVQG